VKFLVSLVFKGLSLIFYGGFSLISLKFYDNYVGGFHGFHHRVTEV
jgi:hypothetical protein